MSIPFSVPVVLIKNAGQPSESRQTVECSVQAKKGYFPSGAPVFEGDTIELDDPRGGKRRLQVGSVNIQGMGTGLDHIEVDWAPAVQKRSPAVERLMPSDLHPEVVSAAGQLYTDGHYAEAIFNAFKAVEVRVRKMSGLDLTGQDLMAQAFSEANPRIRVALEEGLSGESEQRGFKFLFMGAMSGVRNPKGHGFVKQDDPRRTLEYLAFASILLRRLDDAAELRRITAGT